MDTPVSFEIAKLIKEKGWLMPTLHFFFEDGELRENCFNDTVGSNYGDEFSVEFCELTENWNDGFLTKKDGHRCFGCSKSRGYLETFSAPTIAEVVMWLYEKHRIWTEVYPREFKELNLMWSYTLTKIESTYTINGIEFPNIEKPDDIPTWKSLTEAYEAAINYILNNLI